MPKKILFIGGSLNQTTMAHAVAKHLESDYDCYFTPYYCDGLPRLVAKTGWLDFTVLGGQFRESTEAYFREHDLEVDYAGQERDYDLVVTTSDLLIQRNIRGKKIVLIQEGMTDPENFMFPLVKRFKLPRWMAGNTSTTGLSDAYEVFCVASEGYRDFFIKKGVKPEKLVVTGIPNYDNVAALLDNDFPHKNYVLVATSDVRETKRFDNRERFIRQALEIADGRPIIFKLHPNENATRATREIKSLAPQALVFSDGNPSAVSEAASGHRTGHMIANCDVLITQYSTVVYIGIALGKEVHSYFDLEMLKRLTPTQNGGTSGKNIAAVCRRLLEKDPKGLGNL